MTRYLVVHHPNLKRRLVIHELLQNYHWENLDSDHVLVLANLDPRHTAQLEAHPDVMLLPSIFSEATVQVHAQAKNRMRHYQALQSIGVTDQHRMTHLAGIAAQRYGQKLALDL